MRYLSVCSGIEAATVAARGLGWTPVGFAEIDPAACAVLKHHYPDVPNYGDFTKIGTEIGPVDLICGGTPCQDFSVAGRRAGMDGERGNLTLEFIRLVERIRPTWVFWENVPGVLSSFSHEYPDPCPPEIDLDGDNGPGDGEEVVVEDEYDAEENLAISFFMAGISELGYGACYRVLDAQYFGVPQRRRRVFVVGYLRAWQPAAAVLFEPESMCGYPAPGRETREDVAGSLSARTEGGGGLGTDFDLGGGAG